MSAAGEPPLDAAQLQYLAAAALIDGLHAGGVGHFVVCPGSRSAPLAMAIARDSRVCSWVLIDERSAAFFALGMARSREEPIALVCTSGTAGANFLPAVVEARYGGVPLIIMTADRPPELRDTGALQTIDQRNMFAHFVHDFVDLSVADEPGAEDDRRAMGRQAVIHAMTSFGPVHLNVPFREPFVPDPAWEPRPFTSSVPEPDRGKWDKPHPSHDLLAAAVDKLDDDIAAVQKRIIAAKHGVIIAGAVAGPDVMPLITMLGVLTGFPVFADPASSLRGWGPAIPSYDLVLRSSAARAKLIPDIVLRFGATPVSKPLLSWLDELPSDTQVSIHPEGLPNDPTRRCGTELVGDPRLIGARLSTGIPHDKPETDNSGWLRLWRSASATARLGSLEGLQRSSPISEPEVAGLLGNLLPQDSLIWCGASMPLRDLDAFFLPKSPGTTVLANRGVNGIDGVLSSALGAAAGRGQRVVVLCGDVTFAHDISGLLAASRFQLDATIIMINNRGGGIFEFLPQSRHEDVFDQFFGTPVNIDFEGAVTSYKGFYCRVADRDRFTAELTAAGSRPGLTVIEVASGRKANVLAHKAVWKYAEIAVESILEDVG